MYNVTNNSSKPDPVGESLKNYTQIKTLHKSWMVTIKLVKKTQKTIRM